MVPEQYKEAADIFETSVNISRHSDVPQDTSVFNISVNICVLLLSVGQNSGPTLALGSTQPLIEMNTRDISWGVKVAGA